MSLQDLVNVSISSSTVTPTRPGFGTPLLAAYHTVYTDRVRFYSSIAAVAADGFATTSPPYKMAQVAFAANPAPSKVAIGRRAIAFTQVVVLVLSSTSATDTYTLTIVGSDGVSHVLDFASTGVAATDAATLKTAIDALSNVGTCVRTTATLTITQAAGKLTDYKNWNPSGTTTPIMTLQETTADPGLATDLDAIYAGAAKGSWYGLALDNNSKAEITAAAAWTEAKRLVFAWNNSDTICTTTSTSDVFSSEQTLAHARSFGLFGGSALLAYGGVGWLAKTLPSTPGSLTFMYKTLASVPADNLSDTVQTNLTNKKGNFYIPVAGINITINGWTSAGEFIDVTWGTDALVAQIQIDVFALLAGSPKVPYTDLGVDAIKSIVQADLSLFSDPQHQFIAPTPKPTVSAPLVSTLSKTQRASRVFPNVAFSGQLAGAIHSLTIQGVLSP